MAPRLFPDPVDPLESLWPDFIDIEPGHLAVDRYWVRSLSPRGWPHEVGPGWLEPLLQFPYPHVVSLAIEPMAGDDEMRHLTRRLVWTQGANAAAERRGRILDPAMTGAQQDAERLREDLARGETRLFRTALGLSLWAPTRADLDQRTLLLESLAEGLMMPLRRMPYRQAESWLATLPGGPPPTGVREMDSRAAGSLFPFIGDDIQHENGQVWGENPRTHAPLVIDRSRLPAPHTLTVGWSGSGKSFAAKLLTLRARYHGIPVLVMDPEGEYRNLVHGAGLVSVGQGLGLNPLAVGSGPREAARRAEFAVRWLNLLTGGIGSQTERVVQEALADDVPWTPTTWLEELSRRDPRAAARLRGPIRHWASVMGEGGGPIPHEGLVVVDLSEVPPTLKAAAYLVAVEHVLSTLSAKTQRWVVFDEAWYLLGHPVLAPYLEELYRRARKWGTALTLVTQDAHDTLRSPTAAVCLRNSPLVLLLRPHPEAVPELATMFRLSEEECEVLDASRQGEGLLLMDRRRVPIKIRASPMEERLIDGGRSAG